MGRVMDVTIAVCTYGSQDWIELAQSRAIPSAKAQGVPITHWHEDTLVDARNAALEHVDTEWVVFLDADDELSDGYADAMSKGTADLRVPRVSYVRKNHPPREPGFPKVAGHTHACTADCLPEGNWLVIGTAVRAKMLRDVGGWRDFPWSEDWDSWLRCWKAGATIEPISDAVYIAHVRFDSRNRGALQRVRDEAHRAIYAANFS